jgi:D-glucuronyl C5-epimerase C-terminus/FlgD Ig-like domain
MLTKCSHAFARVGAVGSRGSRRAVALAGVLAALTIAAAPAQAATARDAQRAADRVRAALGHMTLTPPQGASDRGSLRAAMRVVRALDTPSKQTRLSELASQLTQMAAIAARGQLTAGRMPELMHQLDANRIWFAARQPPRALSRVTVGSDPIIYGYYPGHGLQIQPLFNWTQANGLWFDKNYTGLQRLIDALAPLMVTEPGGWVALEYMFDYGSGRAPWRSGMPQGVAIQVLARQWQATQNAGDLDLAQRMLPAFDIPTTDGGLLDPSGQRWWPLYAFDPGERILNGDMQVVISLYDYATITGDPVSRVWADEGADVVAQVLPQYDTGAWSRYDQHQVAPLGYHDLMTKQLGQLAARTGNAEFTTYQTRFATYRRTPPTITPSTQAGPYVFYPYPIDGFRDQGLVSVTLSKPASVAVTVTDANQKVVATQQLGSFSGGLVRLGWNGLVGGKPAPPGVYSLAIRATDVLGNRTAPTPVGSVQVERDTTTPLILQLRVARVQGGVKLRYQVADPQTGTLVISVRVGPHTVTRSRLPKSGTATFPLLLPKTSFTAAIRVADTSGNAVSAERHPG